MTFTKHAFSGVLFASLVALTACGQGKAPTCEAIATQSIDRALSDERFQKLPDNVRDSMDAKRDQLEKHSMAACRKRRWSKSVRRCKFRADSASEAAACEDPRIAD